jgi:transcription antitermination factor NusG
MRNSIMVNQNDHCPPLTPQWFALMVRCRSEETVSEQLISRGFQVMFPARVERKRTADRVKSVRKALFPGYTFCRFAPAEKLSVVMTPGVNSIVGNGNEARPIPVSEISALEHLTHTGCELKEVPYVSVGQRVEIVEGALRGVQGIVSDVLKSQLIVSISALGRSVAVQLDQQTIRAI